MALPLRNGLPAWKAAFRFQRSGGGYRANLAAETEGILHIKAKGGCVNRRALWRSTGKATRTEPSSQRCQHPGRGWLFALSRLRSPPAGLVHHYNIHRTIWFPHPTPLLKQSFQQRKPNTSFAVKRKPVRAGSRQMKFPQCLQMGTQPSPDWNCAGCGVFPENTFFPLTCP